MKFELKGMLHQDYQPFGPKNYQDAWAMITHYIEIYNGFLSTIQRFGTF